MPNYHVKEAIISFLERLAEKKCGYMLDEDNLPLPVFRNEHMYELFETEFSKL